jgi:hypothetical protein
MCNICQNYRNKINRTFLDTDDPKVIDALRVLAFKGTKFKLIGVERELNNIKDRIKYFFHNKSIFSGYGDLVLCENNGAFTIEDKSIEYGITLEDKKIHSQYYQGQYYFIIYRKSDVQKHYEIYGEYT